MSNLLFVTSSLFGAESKSRQVAVELIDAWRAENPGTTVTTRDLNAETMPHVTLDTLAASATPAAQRTDVQHAAAVLADTLLAEVEAADTIVLAVPMYNFSIPSTLKAWIDHVVQAGRTFRYTAAGPEGLLKGKKIFVVTGRGGVYTGDSPARALDFQEPYLRALLGFIGLTDVTFIHVEGVKVSAEAAAHGLARARRAIGESVPRLAAA
jgi:FMN-dependent NADH-azoreductase